MQRSKYCRIAPLGLCLMVLRTARAKLMQKLLGTITAVSTHTPVVALTFDDGPHPLFTPRLLDILKKHNAYATFFMIGAAAARSPDIVRQVAKAGHTIGNHSWNHQSFPLLTGRKRRAQLRACQQVIAPYGKRLFRPPYGHQNTVSRLDAFLLGFQVVTWNIVAYDWLAHDAAWMVERVGKQIRPGSIILFHDRLHDYLDPRYDSRDAMLEAVDMLLSEFGKQFRFITIPALLQSGSLQKTTWLMKPDLDFLQKLHCA
jgi:peptidoglycan-N-acetylglucosamine deacetylase